MQPNPDNFKIRRALISVSDKTSLIELARQLVELDIDIVSTGGTYRALQQAEVEVTEVAEITHFPEMMDGRVKTLHPMIHGGILARPNMDEGTLKTHSIAPIDLVIVNLYPFTETVSQPDCTLEKAIENIDIGGPTMVRAAAKNHARVTVVTDINDYSFIVEQIKTQGGLSWQQRFNLAVKAFEHTAGYDGAIANYLGQQVTGSDFPRTLNMQQQWVQTLRYGENPHQQAAFYRQSETTTGSISSARQLQGKPLSFNNIADTDAALETVRQFEGPSCVIVKHANPCGVAIDTSLLTAYERAYATDPESAFGGIIAFNQTLDAKTINAILQKQFVEVIIAPQISSEAAEIAGQKPNIRLLESGPLAERKPHWEIKQVNGGLLVQDADIHTFAAEDLKLVSTRQPSPEQLSDMLFAWKVAKMVKSNAIVYASQQQTIGIGAGQMSRVNSARIAAIKAEHAGLEVMGSVMASDAFFPFRDGIDNAAQYGIEAVIQPGGSMRDQDIIDAANEHNMVMAFTGMRHFRH